MLWSKRRRRSAHGAEISIQTSALAAVEPQTSALAAVEPQTLASSGRETLPLDYRAPPPLLLVASYDMQEDTAGQFEPAEGSNFLQDIIIICVVPLMTIFCRPIMAKSSSF